MQTLEAPGKVAALEPSAPVWTPTSAQLGNMPRLPLESSPAIVVAAAIVQTGSVLKSAHCPPAEDNVSHETLFFHHRPFLISALRGPARHLLQNTHRTSAASMRTHMDKLTHTQCGKVICDATFRTADQPAREGQLYTQRANEPKRARSTCTPLRSDLYRPQSRLSSLGPTREHEN